MYSRMFVNGTKVLFCESVCLKGLTCLIRFSRSLPYRIKTKRIQWFRCCYEVADRLADNSYFHIKSLFVLCKHT